MKVKKVFTIENKTNDTAQIDIFGEIGDGGWFGEGYSMKDAKKDLDKITAKKIIVNIASLGGQVDHALVIYDLLRAKDAELEVRVMGTTASSGTVVAMAGGKEGSTIKMSKNSLFLIHNAWSIVAGDAEKVEAFAKQLRIHDQRLVEIYAGVTGKDDKKIKNLMKENKWIDATEAEEFGFVNEVYEPDDIAAKFTPDAEKVKNFKHLPDLPKEKEKKAKKETGLLKEIKEMIQNLVTTSNKDDNPLQQQIDDINARYESLNDELTQKDADHEDAIREKDEEITNLKDQITTLQAQVDEDGAGETETEKDKDDDARDDDEPDERAKALEEVARTMRSE